MQNGGTVHGAAVGFDIESLLILKDVHATDPDAPSSTLLNFVKSMSSTQHVSCEDGLISTLEQWPDIVSGLDRATISSLPSLQQIQSRFQRWAKRVTQARRDWLFLYESVGPPPATKEATPDKFGGKTRQGSSYDDGAVTALRQVVEQAETQLVALEQALLVLEAECAAIADAYGFHPAQPASISKTVNNTGKESAESGYMGDSVLRIWAEFAEQWRLV